MGLEFDANKPIYLQLIHRISSEIVRGDKREGEKLPSVREYAVEVGVNTNTISRVYRELELLQIVTTKRGQGTFVTEDVNRLTRLREEMKQEQIKQFIMDMQEMGFSINEMLEGIMNNGSEGQ
ncbi:GntR family transcriptional regulator [Oceanobacillus bengalensis]|uniref:GntR family transcriptional regulator n=1 Tax=Oceanobacillus bengalensis TaxID=1435466 RepID=A0A494YWD5_9BACI|nr:GntR family transcriptional regulator [Oceanobacillus bengalensis]RKQ14526.1 GntR family transcriptional regulator [Oceanobacillus bengalensis]